MAAVRRRSVTMARNSSSTLVPSPSPVAALPREHVRNGRQPNALRQGVADRLHYSTGRLPAVASRHDYYRALALAIRDRMQDHWVHTTEACFEHGHKIACYLSAEFLLGPHLGNNLLNLDLERAARTA